MRTKQAKKSKPLKPKPPIRRPAASMSLNSSRKKAVKFGESIRLEPLIGLTAELKTLRQFPPVTQQSSGRYEGDILGFVRGLRLSARVLYFLRDHLSGTGLQVSWGHLISDSEESCSPECDIIVHQPGIVRRWNGSDNPVMNFSFINARDARLVVSCKSTLSSIDAQYPKDLKKHGVKSVFLFAETCKASALEGLRKRAVKAGYAGFWCLYTTSEADPFFFKTDEPMLIDFGTRIFELANRRPKGQRKAKV
jgi:hypothetical protein